MDLAGRPVLVTGASGFIGGHLALHLAAAENAHVRALVRHTSRVDHIQDSPVALHFGDITDLDAVRQAMDGVDLVFHCAAMVKDWGPAEEFSRVNVTGTETVLAATLDTGIKHFVHTSSTAVYGLDPPDGVDETFPCVPTGDPYSDSKIEAEEQVLRTHHETGLPVTILRPGDVYGPRSMSGTLGPLVAIKLGWVELIDGGTGICNHLYVTNLVDANVLAARRDPGEGAAFTITDGVGTPWREFWGRYAHMVGKGPLPSITKQEAIQKATDMEDLAAQKGRPPMLTRTAVALLTRSVTLSIEKAQTELGYQPRVSLDEGMARTETWLRQEGYL